MQTFYGCSCWVSSGPLLYLVYSHLRLLPQGVPTESSTYHKNDLFCTIAGAGLLLLIAPFVNIQFLGSSLTFMMVSRAHHVYLLM